MLLNIVSLLPEVVESLLIALADVPMLLEASGGLVHKRAGHAD